MADQFKRTIDVSTAQNGDVFQLGSAEGTDANVELHFSGMTAEDSVWQLVEYNDPDNQVNIQIGINQDGEEGIKVVTGENSAGYLAVRLASIGTETTGTLDVVAFVKD